MRVSVYKTFEVCVSKKKQIDTNYELVILLATLNNKTINKISVNFKFYDISTKSELKFVCMFIMFECHNSICLSCLRYSWYLVDFFVSQILFFSEVLSEDLSANPMLYVAKENSFSLNLSRIKWYVNVLISSMKFWVFNKINCAQVIYVKSRCKILEHS